MEELSVEMIQERLKDLLRRQVVAGSQGGLGGMAISIAKAACRTAGIPEEETRLAIADGLQDLMQSGRP